MGVQQTQSDSEGKRHKLKRHSEIAISPNGTTGPQNTNYFFTLFTNTNNKQRRCLDKEHPLPLRQTERVLSAGSEATVAERGR